MNTREIIPCSEKCEIMNWFPKLYASEANVICKSKRVRVPPNVLACDGEKKTE